MTQPSITHTKRPNHHFLRHPNSFLTILTSVLLLLTTLPQLTLAIKFELGASKHPIPKCIWNTVHEHALVIITANVSPGDKQRVDVEVVDSSDHRNVYLSKKDINGETRLAVTSHIDGDIGVCFTNTASPGEYKILFLSV